MVFARKSGALLQNGMSLKVQAVGIVAVLLFCLPLGKTHMRDSQQQNLTKNPAKSIREVRFLGLHLLHCRGEYKG